MTGPTPADGPPADEASPPVDGPPPPLDGPPADGPPPLPAEALPERGRVATWVRRGLALAAVAAVLGAAASLTGRTEPMAARTVTPALADGCQRVTSSEGVDRSHLDAATAPPVAEVYGTVPPVDGRHYGRPHPLVVDASLPADPRATTHNLEHGAIVVHVDAGRLGLETAAQVEDWARQLVAAGFDAPEASSGVLVVAMPLDATTDAAVALRSWGLGVDCTGWDLATADAFVAERYGDRGEAPEGGRAPYPEDNGVLLEGSFA